MAKNEYPLNYVSQNLNAMLAEMITEYSTELQAKAEKVTEQIANEFSEELAQVTPRSSAAVDQHLADSIVVTKKLTKYYGAKQKAFYVHFKKWQISHLLEFGWTAKNGHRINRTPFVRPLFDKNKEKYYRMYKEELSK